MVSIELIPLSTWNSDSFAINCYCQVHAQFCKVHEAKERRQTSESNLYIYMAVNWLAK